jgi:hypothetical protein
MRMITLVPRIDLGFPQHIDLIRSSISKLLITSKEVDIIKFSIFSKENFLISKGEFIEEDLYYLSNLDF